MITKGMKLIVTKPVGNILKVGEVCEILDIVEGSLISFKFGKDGYLKGMMTFDECEKHFAEYEEVKSKPKKTWSKWEYRRWDYFNIHGYRQYVDIKFRSNGECVQMRCRNLKSSARCHQLDTFDLVTGVNIAWKRMQIKILQEELEDYLKTL